MPTSQEVNNLASYKVRADSNAQNEWTQYVRLSNGLVPESFDAMELGWNGTVIETVTYKLAGVTVGTLTLAYDGGRLTNVTRS